MKRVIPCTILLLSLGASTGCKNTDFKDIIPLSKESLGGVLGAGGGLLVGQRFCGGKYETLCKIGTTTLGAYVGGKIGKKLDEEDQKKMALTTREALSSGTTQSWSNSQNNTSGTARVIRTQTKSEPVKVVVLKKRVKQVPPLDILGENYKATSNANLRGGPGTDYEKVGLLQSGDIVNAVGQVKGSDWYLISQNGVGSGFIRSDLIVKAPQEQVVIDDRQLDESELAQTEITSERKCRTIEQTVNLADGSSQSETLEACQGANGWEVNT
ncbi:MAG: SH3 domain-containing protein [Neptuniibacter sp.]